MEWIDAMVMIKWNELKTYPFIKKHIESLEKEIEKTSDKLQEIGDVKAVRYDNDIHSENHVDTSELYNEVLSYEKDLRSWLLEEKRKIFLLERFVDRMEDEVIRTISKEKFFQGKTWNDITLKYEGKYPYKEKHGIEILIKSEMKKIIKEDMKNRWKM